MKKRATHKELERIVKPLYEKKDSMHNFAHILRIKRKSLLLRKQYKKVDPILLNFLIYFHGLKKWVKRNKPLLFDLGFSRKNIKVLLKRNKKPILNEEKIVFDANMLENVGKFGIKKMLILEKEYGQNRKETIKLAKKFLSEYKFYTPLGKTFGEKGISIRKNWLKKVDPTFFR